MKLDWRSEAPCWLLLGAMFGAAAEAYSLARTVWALLAALVVFGLAMLAISIYSYFPWRDDPNKVPPGGHVSAGGSV